MSETDLTAIVANSLAPAPQWVRHDLGASDVTLRMRAEETLAAMIAAALTTTVDPASSSKFSYIAGRLFV